MLNYLDGDILDFHDDKQYGKITTIAIPVNVVGVMGAGLALQFKNAYPELFESYKLRLKHIERVGIDPMMPFLIGNSNEFIMFPTKRHWKNKSKLVDVQNGLKYIRKNMGGLFYNLAFPKLGCGLGGLKWIDVEKSIINTFEDVHYNVFIFGKSEHYFTNKPDESDESNFARWVLGI